MGDALDVLLVVLRVLGIKPGNTLPQKIRFYLIGLQFSETIVPLHKDPLFELSQCLRLG